ncbi:hypothetical protein [Methanobrevibacter ruminantium]|uniref:hypothetical protein n=1 Tax=Methanobrevibacter ruminantium TaxID=83816 RepID=UPI0026EAD400|nr:hypothetical protein [Methanobrevibacter ruminantium]
MGLKFKDIDKWKPTSISIVDKPSHPLAVFEVYEDDEEFIKKYSPVEVDKLSNTKEANDETVTVSSSFFEKLLGGLVSKAEEPPSKPPVKEEGEEEEGKDDKLDEIIKRLDAFDERLKKLENPEEAPGAVAKSEGAAGDGGEGQGEGEAQTNTEGQEGKGEEEEKPIVDDKTMVKKSKEVDPDLNKGSSATESFMKRIGRSEDGMKW